MSAPFNTVKWRNVPLESCAEIKCLIIRQTSCRRGRWWSSLRVWRWYGRGKVSGRLYSLNWPIIASSEPPRLLRSHLSGLVNQRLPSLLRYLSRSPGLKAELWRKSADSLTDDSQITVWWIWNVPHLPLESFHLHNSREYVCVPVWSTWCAHLMCFDEKDKKAFSRWLRVSEY